MSDTSGKRKKGKGKRLSNADRRRINNAITRRFVNSMAPELTLTPEIAGQGLTVQAVRIGRSERIMISLDPQPGGVDVLYVYDLSTNSEDLAVYVRVPSFTDEPVPV